MNRLFWCYLLISGLLVSFGQPIWLSAMGMLSGIAGFALFWKAMLYFPEKKQRFWTAVFWFGTVQAIQLSWMTATQYVGVLVLPVYILLALVLGLQFGLLSSFISPNNPLLFRRCLALSGCWVLFEWSRIFILTGFTWNPVGLALSCSQFSVQFATLFGVYGLSFWVILVNLVGLNAFFISRTLKSRALWVVLALFPYGFGWVHQSWVEAQYKNSSTVLSVALIETGLSVEQKYGNHHFPDGQLSPLEQWVLVWGRLNPGIAVDLIVLPEGAFPGTAYRSYYFLEEVREEWIRCFGEESIASFPPLKSPLAFPYLQDRKIHWKVNNAFLTQALSNYFNADVIIGLNDEKLSSRYNAAFCFHPDQSSPEKHLKRILAPVGEYIPLSKISWIGRFIEENFGICDSFDEGKEATVFSGKIPIGVVICLEEVYSGVVRELRQKGARLFVSLSNDVWFPSSRLPQQHFEHGRIRSVENGVYLLRSSNMGVTGAVDCLGNLAGALPLAASGGEALYLSLPIYSYPTLYSWWGDQAILCLSLAFLSFFCAGRIYNRKSCP